MLLTLCSMICCSEFVLDCRRILSKPLTVVILPECAKSEWKASRLQKQQSKSYGRENCGEFREETEKLQQKIPDMSLLLTCRKPMSKNCSRQTQTQIQKEGKRKETALGFFSEWRGHATICSLAWRQHAKRGRKDHKPAVRSRELKSDTRLLLQACLYSSWQDAPAR